MSERPPAASEVPATKGGGVAEIARHGVVAAFAVATLGSLPFVRDLPAPYDWISPFLQIGGAAAGAVVGAVAIVAHVRNPRRSPLGWGVTAERTLGLPYRVQIGTPDGFAPWWDLTVGHDAIDAHPLDPGLPWKRFAPKRLPLADVVLVRPRTAWIDVVCEREGRRTTFEIRNAGYADRERLLWELAVRVPEALERAIEGGASPPAAPATAASGRFLPPTGPRRDGADSAPAGDPRALAGLDAAMDGLGSALVAAPSRTPAPPRSGLGCGLFVAPPGDDAGRAA